MGSTETFIQMLESATLEPARCCSACQITEQGFLARDEMATGMCRSGWSLSSCFGLPSSDERSRQKSKGSTRQLVSLETELQFRLKPKGLRIGSKDTPHPTTMSCSVLTCSSPILSFSLSLSRTADNSYKARMFAKITPRSYACTKWQLHEASGPPTLQKCNESGRPWG